MTLSPSPAGIGQTVTVSWRLIQGGGTLPDSGLCTSGDFPIAITVSRRWAPPEIDLGYDSTTGDCSGISRVSGNAYDGVYQTQFTVGSDWTSVDGGYVVEIDYTNPTSGGVQTQFTGTGWNVAAPPGPPSGWPSPTVSGQTIVFTWTEPESELPISHYVVSQSRMSTQWTWSVINDNYVDSARSVSVTADWGESVCFDVYAVAGGVNGATATSTPGTQYCGKPLTAPGVPTSFEVTQIAGASWSAPEFDGGCKGTGNDPSALDYEVQTSTNGTTYSGSYETKGTTLSSLNWPSWYEENQTRFYRVRAICDAHEGEFSEVVSVIYEHTPGRISSLNCLGGWQGDGTRECSWTAPPSGGSPVTHYEIRYSYIVGDNSLEWTYISEPITGTTYTITGLTFGNYSDRYYIHVLAFNKWGATTRNRSNDRTGYWSNGMTASATEYWDN